ncbi:TVP38/TMEM64 family protein [Paenibacillus sp. MWE-103]|uniref:TVP38/TMEM64 family membrane protein n=1 Tax=Paenibacillus artemisiicola TaxID=1172618 RepID=A0ABS3W4J1_9BACL|nr:VTT domain-containing protein [Paenibacillus artemisiicola]MBO7743226.1 TVP38/TMEM64 family protein [Paenibacillus artemisiicola]
MERSPNGVATAWKRWLPIPAYLALLAAVWANRAALLAWMQSGDASPALMLLLVTGLAFVPVIPFSVVIGTMGFLYGALPGALISLTGAWLAALVMYGLFRYALHGRARRLLGKHRATERWTALVERYPFRSIVAARLLPVVPQQAVNVYAAALPIPFAVYAGASLLGKMPAMLVFAFIGGQLAGDRKSLIAAVCVYAAFLLAVYAGNRIWARLGTRGGGD